MLRSSIKPALRSPFRTVTFLALAAAATCALVAQSPSSSDLHAKFLNPPQEARPMMRWWWFGPAVEKQELATELETMQKAGIGGVEIQPVYPMLLDDQAKGIKNLRYMSPEFLEAVTFANQKARSLGLRVDITLGSGWPFGGPNTPIAQAATRLRVEYAPVEGAHVKAPHLTEGESLVAAFVTQGSKSSFDALHAVRFDPAGAVPEGQGERVALYFIQTHTLQMVKRAALGAEGFVLDHMSRVAVDNHLAKVGEPLVKAFGTDVPYSVFSDSLEVYGSDWTPTMAEEFQKRRGYDLVARLPELLAGNTPEADAIRHDWGVTMSDLVRDNYLIPVTQFAEAHGTKFRSQTYGVPAVILADETIPALPEGEGPQWRAFSFTRWASSANHLTGNPVTSAETWTWLHSPAFRATPLDMKVEADRMLLEGVNQFVGHGWPYSPAGAGEPGWSLYAAAVFNQHNPWFTVMPDITAYLGRMSWLLRQGKAANDIAILLPEDDAQAGFSPTSMDLAITGEMQKHIPPALMATILDAGYNVDYIDAKMIDKLGSIPYPVLVIPTTERMPLATYKKIAEYAAGKGKVIGIGAQATLAPGLKDQDDSPAVVSITREIFQAAGHKGVAIASIDGLAAALHTALAPDVDAKGQVDQLGFIHRKVDGSDIYYLVNSSNQAITGTVAFRAAQPALEAWSPDTGNVLFAAANTTGKRFPLELAPYESRVYVLSAKGPVPATVSLKQNTLADISTNWTVRFESDKKETNLPALTSWTEMEGRKFFSGIATYSRNVTVDAAALKNGRVLLDFGQGQQTTDPRPPGANGIRALLDPPVREAAIVKVNGKQIGSLWHPPYQIDITDALRAGNNSIEVSVANTAINLMAGNGPHDFTALYAVYGKRFEMQDMNNLQPVPSGLMGPVRLLTARK